jgi:hypothetical protein
MVGVRRARGWLARGSERGEGEKVRKSYSQETEEAKGKSTISAEQTVDQL